MSSRSPSRVRHTISMATLAAATAAAAAGNAASDDLVDSETAEYRRADAVFGAYRPWQSAGHLRGRASGRGRGQSRS